MSPSNQSETVLNTGPPPRGVLVISMNTSSCLLPLLIWVQIYVGFLPRGLWPVFCRSDSQLEQNVFIGNSATRTVQVRELVTCFRTLTGAKLHTQVYCIMSPSSLVGVYQRYRRISCLHLQDLTWHRTFLHKASTRLPNHTAS
jgi:hypothetical protein